MRKRVELSRIKIYTREITSDNTDENEGNAGIPATGLPDCGAEFKLAGENLTSHGPQHASTVTDDAGMNHPDMGGWPETEVAFTVSESDIPRVTAWFDDEYQGVTSPESALLQKNRTAAVHSALDTYLATATSANLFTSPFRLGWCYRLTDNTLTPLHDMGLMWSFMTAPRLPVISNQLTDKYLYTRVQVRNIPARLHYRFSPAAEFTASGNRIRGIEIYATQPAEMFDPKGGVAGIRTITIDGSPRRCWHYDRYTEEEVRLRASQDNVFKRISSIPFDEIVKTEDFKPLPIAAGALSGFSRLPAYDSQGDTPTTGQTHLRITTEPLHLDYPEDEKSIRSLTVRGIFQRGQITTRLYGSQHREDWHPLASVSGAYIRGICCTRWRWFRVEIESRMREGDFIEALTFEFSV